MKKLSECIAAGIRITNRFPESVVNRKYFRQQAGAAALPVFDALALAHIGSASPSSVKYLHSMIDRAVYGLIATHITNSLNESFPCLFERVTKFKPLLHVGRDLDATIDFSKMSVFSFIAMLNDVHIYAPPSIVELLSQAGL